MIKQGTLCVTKASVTDANLLCEVVSTYDKRDIDYDCPESVAIIPMVKAVYLSGENQGKEFRVSRRSFTYRWEVVRDA